MDIILLCIILFAVICCGSIGIMYCKFVFAEQTAINIAHSITGNVIDVKRTEHEIKNSDTTDRRMKNLENIIEYFGENRGITFNGAEIENILKNIY